MKKQDKEKYEAKVDKEQSELLEAELNKDPEETVVEEPVVPEPSVAVTKPKPKKEPEINAADELPNIPVRRV